MCTGKIVIYRLVRSRNRLASQNSIYMYMYMYIIQCLHIDLSQHACTQIYAKLQERELVKTFSAADLHAAKGEEEWVEGGPTHFPLGGKK